MLTPNRLTNHSNKEVATNLINWQANVMDKYSINRRKK